MDKGTLAIFTPAESGYRRLSAHWFLSRDADPVAVALYQRHYTCPPKRRHSGFAGPGEKLVLLTGQGDALFVWRRELYRKDGLCGVNCSVFRNESAERSSALIAEACEIAWARWPGERLFTFIDPARVRSPNPGYCFLMAGFRRAGVTRENRLLHLERLPIHEGALEP